MALRDGRAVPSFAREALCDLSRAGFVVVPTGEEGEGGAAPAQLTANGQAASDLIARTLGGLGDAIAKPHIDNRGRGSWR